MTPDLKELERLARAATPGPWTYDGDTWELSAPSRKGKVEIATIETGWTEPMESEQQANIAYILAANPAAILSLIAELTRPETTIVSIMRAELEQARKDAENIRKEINEQPIRRFLAPAYANNDLAATGRNDVLYAQAVDLIKKHGKYSISLVQRHLKISYNRAVWMVEHAKQDAAIAKESA